MSDELDCLRCGACCHGEFERYVRVTGDDHARLGEHAERATQFVGHRCYMRMDLARGHCVALRHEADKFVCGLYEVRPQTCRDLEKGSPACTAERERKATKQAADRARRSLPVLPL